MLIAIIGLGSAVIWGASDFFGGFAAKRLTAVQATFVAFLAALVTVLLLLCVSAGEWSDDVLFWGVIAGVSGVLGAWLLYACLAIGPMSILSPLAAVVGAVVPVAIGLAGGESLGSFAVLGVIVALVAAVLLGFVPDKEAVKPTVRGLLYAVLAGAFFGLYLAAIHKTPEASGLLPLAVDLVTGSVLLGIVLIGGRVLGRRRALAGVEHASVPPVPDDPAVGPVITLRRALWAAVACGVIMAVANSLQVWGLHLGELAIVSVLSSLYPLGTVLLAAAVLRERITLLQALGLALALTATALLAAG